MLISIVSQSASSSRSTHLQAQEALFSESNPSRPPNFSPLADWEQYCLFPGQLIESEIRLLPCSLWYNWDHLGLPSSCSCSPSSLSSALLIKDQIVASCNVSL